MVTADSVNSPGTLDYGPNHITDEAYFGQLPQAVLDVAASHHNDSPPVSLDFMTGEWGDLFPADVLSINATSLDPSPPALAVSCDSDDATYSLGAPNQETETMPMDGQQGTSETVSYFISHVDPPFIMPWDSSNWSRMKPILVDAGRRYPAVLAGINAVAMLYKSLSDGGEESNVALPAYFNAKSLFISLLKRQDTDIDVILMATLLLCCFEVVAQQETTSCTLKQKDSLVSRLEAWSRTQPTWSPICRRIIVWLRLFHTKALHLGGRGMLGPNVLEVFQAKQPPGAAIAAMRNPSTGCSLATGDITFDAIDNSLFHFYCDLQHISTLVSALNRHHRPRGSSEDEFKVDELSKDIVSRLEYLWQERPNIMDVESEKMGQVLIGCSVGQVAHLSLLARLCRVSYCAEIIYHARGQGRSRHASSPAIIAAKAEIRSGIHEAAVLARAQPHNQSRLHPAFLWPLFLFAVESNNGDDLALAANYLKMTTDPLWNSEIVTSLIGGLTNEQLLKGDRVDSRYFCVDRLGVVPPFM